MRYLRTILAATALCAAAICHAQSRGATEAWVTNYVARTLADYASGATSKVGITNYFTYNGITMFYEDATERGLIVSQDTAASRMIGLTNNFCFAKESATNYVHAPFSISVWTNGLTLRNGASGYPARTRNGVETWFFDEATTNWLCRISYTYLQPTVASRILAMEGE